MSFLSRLFGKSEPAETAPGAEKPEVREPPPRPDHAARLAEEEANLNQAIASGDMASIGRWVLEGSSTRIRQAAAAVIEDMDQLHELIRATRHGKDKAVYRILTSRRDERLAESRRIEQLHSDLDAVSAAIARHARLPHNAMYAATLAQLEERWRSLEASAAQALQAEVRGHLAAAHQVIDDNRREAEAEAGRERAAARAREEARHQREIESRAAEAAAAQAAASERDRELEAEKQTELRERTVAAEREAGEAKRRDLVVLLRRAQAALERGGTARAARLRDEIREKLADTPALPPWFERQLQQLESRLADLQDWKTFRVEPKRAELVQRMQGLIGADLSPEELARHVRRLREEWRTLNRGAGEEPTPEWEEFQQAAERAYEPCREHFARQAEQRRENQARREALLERLSAFVAGQDAGTPDLRAVQRVLLEARKEWREYAPVEQAAVKPLQARFHALLKPLQAQLDAEYDRNVQARRELIARAAELAKHEDVREAMQEAKGLQREWKAIGPVRRKQGDTLWEEFRRHCDAVFQRGSQESAAHATVLEANLARARAICEELEAFAAVRDTEPSFGPRELDELRDEISALELPRASVRELRRRFAEASDGCRDALERQRKAAARRSWEDLFTVSAMIRASALASLSGPGDDALATMHESAATALAGLEHASKEARAVLERQLAAVAAGNVSADLAANEAAMRLLCVRAELAAGLPTPPEDLERRREYQMQRLVAAMGQGERHAPAELGELALEWLDVGPIEAVTERALLARFQRCLG